MTLLDIYHRGTAYTEKKELGVLCVSVVKHLEYLKEHSYET